MLVSVIVPTIRAGVVSDTIDSILGQTNESWELIVVPQGPNREMIEVLDDYVAKDPRIRYVHVDMMNASHARNVGMAAARGDVFAFTDDDCVAAPDWLDIMVEHFERHPEVGILGGEVVAPRNTQPWRISSCPAAHVLDAVYIPEEADFHAPPGYYMIGANFAFRREAVERIGRFDTALGAGAYFACCEDQDFGLRAEALGIASMTTPRLVVLHKSGRRYGLKQFIKHQRNYALGRGAWVAKLQMWNHRLGDEWSRPRTRREEAGMLLTRPHRWLFEHYADHYKRTAADQYRAMYTLGDDLLSHPIGREPLPTADDVVAVRRPFDVDSVG